MKVDVNLKYENYIFDLYGTLIDIHTEEDELKLWEALAEFYGKQGASYEAQEIWDDYVAFVGEELKKSEEIQVEIVFKKLF